MSRAPEAAAMPVECTAGRVTLGDLDAIAAATRRHLAARVDSVDVREWQSSEAAQRYVDALTTSHVWVAAGAVHATVRYPFDYVAGEALDAASNDVPGDRGAAYITDRAGYYSLYYGPAAARELGFYHATHGGSPFGDLDDSGSAELMTWLGQTEPTTEANHAYRMALVEAYRAALNSHAVGDCPGT